MNASTTSRADRAGQPRGTLALWTGMIGPPLVWLTQFEIKYVLAGGVAGSGRHIALIATGIVALALLAWSGRMSWQQWRLSGDSPLDLMSGITSRIRFMAAVGMMSAALFFLLTAAQGMSDLFFEPGTR